MITQKQLNVVHIRDNQGRFTGRYAMDDDTVARDGTPARPKRRVPWGVIVFMVVNIYLSYHGGVYFSSF